MELHDQAEMPAEYVAVIAESVLTINPARKKVWTDEDGDYLRILRFDEQRIEIATMLPYSDLPPHDYVNFHFNRLTLAVEGSLSRNKTPEELSKSRAESGFREGDIDFCVGPTRVAKPSQGQCREFARAF